MGRTAKIYIYGVIAAGATLLAWSLASWPTTASWPFAIFTLLAMAASVLKVRLPGMDGTYSLNFLFLLYGVAHFSLTQTLVAGCAAAAAQTLLNRKKPTSAIQLLFNIANLIVSIGVCFAVTRVWLAAGMVHYLPAVMTLVACVYFVVNTVIVSGVLSLVQHRPLREIFGEWYVWSFPYYLAGVVVVGLCPAPGYAVPGQAWLVLVPMVYLVHFFLGLAGRRDSSPAIGEQPNASLPPAALLFVATVVIFSLIAFIVATLQWQPESPTRFVVYLALGVLASTFKISLPRMRGSISPSFVLTLIAIGQLSLAETTVLTAVLGLVQVLWRPTRRPMAAQVLFNPACLVLSSSVAWGLSRVLLEPWLDHSTAGVLAAGTLVLFGSNTFLVATVLALVDRKPLSSVWQLCYFWSLPYYLVGGAAAGLMTAITRIADWPSSLLVLPMLTLVYISYRTHLSRACAQRETVAA